jgi:hypothetical protein
VFMFATLEEALARRISCALNEDKSMDIIILSLAHLSEKWL